MHLGFQVPGNLWGSEYLLGLILKRKGGEVVGEWKVEEVRKDWEKSRVENN